MRHAGSRGRPRRSAGRRRISAAGPFDDDAAALEQHQPVHHLHRGAHVLLHQQDGEPGRGQRAHRVQHLRRPAGARGRSTARPAAARCGPIISARPMPSIWRSPPDSCAAQVPAPLRQPRKQLVDLVATVDVPARRSGRLRAASSRFSSTVICAEDQLALGHQQQAGAHAMVRRPARRRAGRASRTCPPPAALPRDQPGERVDQRGLAGAVGADHAHHLARAQRDESTAQCRQAAQVAGHMRRPARRPRTCGTGTARALIACCPR